MSLCRSKDLRAGLFRSRSSSFRQKLSAGQQQLVQFVSTRLSRGAGEKGNHYRVVVKSYLKTANSCSSNMNVKDEQEYYKLVLNILCVTYFVTLITMPDPQTSDMRHIR